VPPAHFLNAETFPSSSPLKMTCKIKKEPPKRLFLICKEVLKKMPAVNASEKAKEKAELGTRIASRLSLLFVSEKELGEN
jgi:hypothetical protein